jgi:hypothetical protein
MANAAIKEMDLTTVIGQINEIMRLASPEINGQQEVAQPWHEIIDQMLGFQQLADDWDGLGAKAPPMSLIRSSVELAQRLQHHNFRLPCRAVAGPDGEILLEWQERGIYVEAEICRPHMAEWMLVHPDGTTKHWVTPLDPPSMS